MCPPLKFYQNENDSSQGLIFFGTTAYAALEAMEMLSENGNPMDAIRVRSFPFNSEVMDFIEEHDEVFVIEQNKDAQFRTLLINELEVNPKKLTPVLNYDGMPITAARILEQINGAAAPSNPQPLQKSSVK